MKLDFYYFSYQCPLNDTMINLLDEYKDKIDIHIYDFADEYSLTKEMDIYFPTLIVLNEEKRYYSPLRKTFLEQVAEGKYPEEMPYCPEQSKIKIENIVEPLTIENIDVACECCGNKTESNCDKKRKFLSGFNLDIFGYIHKDIKGNLIGGVEYLPAKYIPYNIPHDENTAFITCAYMSDKEYDYKSKPLYALEKYLKNNYIKVMAISDEKGTFPNGDLDFFTRNCYSDEGVIYEDANYCKLHLVSKYL